MSRDAGCPSDPDRGHEGRSQVVEHCARVGEQLSRASDRDRDLAWHVMAYHVGDLSALVSARLEASGAGQPGRRIPVTRALVIESGPRVRRGPAEAVRGVRRRMRRR
jgi:hypothetical protein